MTQVDIADHWLTRGPQFLRVCYLDLVAGQVEHGAQNYIAYRIVITDADWSYESYRQRV